MANKIFFPKADNKFGTISRALSLAQLAVPSSAHQHGRASGIVDGNFPYWLALVGVTSSSMCLACIEQIQLGRLVKSFIFGYIPIFGSIALQIWPYPAPVKKNLEAVP